MDPNVLTITPEDLTLLTDVLDTYPSMRNTAHAVKVIERNFTYPIPSLEALLQIFGDRTDVQVGNCRVTPKEVQRFLPESCFPIDNRPHLICHLIMAFDRERMSAFSRVAVGQGPNA
jgi:hypothetical protein